MRLISRNVRINNLKLITNTNLFSSTVKSSVNICIVIFNQIALKVNKKARRKPMSERYTCKKEWNKDDAIKALTLENAYNHLIKKVPMLILRFPDPELNKGLIHSYSPAIETVHFQQPSRARYAEQ